MLRQLFQKYSMHAAIATLMVLAVVTVGACIVLGVKPGLIVGGILFMLLDGLGSSWEILTYRTRKEIGLNLERDERESFSKGTKDNPTIR
jgi:hypothetical protein